jgi:hypothetical protein
VCKKKTENILVSQTGANEDEEKHWNRKTLEYF